MRSCTFLMSERATMGEAKAIAIRPIPGKTARAFVRANHYSGKTVNNSNIHLGVFLRGRLQGAMQFGPPLDKRKLIGLVEGTPWNGLIELNRMAFADTLPRNSESRAIGVAVRLLRQHYPALRFIVSFADATQCGDGCIYRASGFLLTGITVNKNLCRLPDGRVIHKISLEASGTSPRPELAGRSYFGVTGGRYDFAAYVSAAGGEVLTGHMLRYVRLMDPADADALTVPAIPFTEIERRGARMYKGVRPDAG